MGYEVWKQIEARNWFYNGISNSHFNGFGPRIGGQANHEFNKGFSVFAHGAVALLVGNKNVRLSGTNRSVSTFVENSCFWVAYFTWDDWEDLTDWESEVITKYNPPLNQASEEYRKPLTDLGYSQSQYLARYKEIQDMIKILEQEKEELKPNIISILEENDCKIETDNYKAWINARKVYRYSHRVDNLQQALIKLQKEEESSGIAEIRSVVVFPVVRGKNK
jgi:hypothetical protein